MGAPQTVTFSGGESPSVDELAGGTPAQVNLLIDAAGALRSRPGITVWGDFPSAVPAASPVIGIHAWGTAVIYVTADRRIWAWLSPGLVLPLSDLTVPTTLLDGSLRPVFVSTRTRIIIAGGGKPQKWEGYGQSARLGGSPPSFSHVTTISQRIVGNDSGVSGLIYWSDIGDTGAETWETGLNFMEAETKQDPVIGLYENTNELVALGTETIQMFSPDPSVTFSPSRTIEVGWGPPHSYVQFDEQFRGLDSRCRFIVSEGRSFRDFSTPSIAQQLDDIGAAGNLGDCWGMRHKFGAYDLGVWTFPTDGRAFAFNTPGSAWTEFRGYDTTRGAFAAWAPTAHYFWADRQLNLVGLADGRIALLDPTATTDLGAPIVTQATSTFEANGTSRQKKCDGARIKFHRGGDVAGGNNVALLSYRDDLGPFCEPFRLEIGDAYDVDPVISIRSLGTYRQRQWRITVDSAAFRFVGMEVDVVGLGQ